MAITSTPYGNLPGGEPVELFTLDNGRGLSVDITNYGGIVVAIRVPDRDGNIADVVLGKPDLASYLAGHPHFGAITGRVAGRVTGARFTLDGKEYRVAPNDDNGINHLHGGEEGLDKALWRAETMVEDGREKLRLRHLDPDGHNGYPGNLDCTVDYSLSDDNALVIDYRLATDQPTPVTVTNHSYFNLAGEGSSDILGHELQIFADEYAVTDDEMTLLGQKRPVAGANDFREPAVIGDRIQDIHQNHGDAYFLCDGRTAEPRLVARVREPQSGRVLETLTTEPGMQLYLSAMMEPGEVGKTGTHDRFAAICLEAQDYPDALNAPQLGCDIVLRPGQDFRSTTCYRFSVE